MTQPTSLLPGCTVYADGVRLADGQPTELDTDPVVLTDLAVTWGRNNTLDQPSPATCSFRMLDVAGGKRFLDQIRIGTRITVQADAVIFPDPSKSTIPTLIPGPVEFATVTGSGTTSNVITATGAINQSARVTYPPKAYSSDPSAWDGVPRTLAGGEWILRASLTFPAMFAGWRGYAALIRPVTFDNPAGPGTVLDEFTGTFPAGGGPVELRFVPPPGVWLGFWVRIFPIGPAWDQLNSTTWASLAATPAWSDLSTFVLSAVQMLAPEVGALRSGAVFDGRATDLEARYDLDVGGTIVDVIAQDDTAELANRYVGDIPWNQETLLSRFGKIVTASGQALNYTVDAAVQAVQVSYTDVDSQPATTLLQRLATSVAGVLWSATSLPTGPFLRLEDVNSRPAMFKMVMTPPLLTNLMSKANFENGLVAGEFVGAGCTVAIVAVSPKAAANTGTNALRMTSTQANNCNVGLLTAIKPLASPGKTYRVSAFVRAPSAPGAVKVRLDASYRDAANTVLGGTSTSPAVALSTAWQLLEVVMPVAPATTVMIGPTLNATSGVIIGSQVEWDGIMVHEYSGVAEAFFDGHTVDSPTVWYEWNGGTGISTTTRYGIYSIEVNPTAAGVTLDACVPLLEPVRWQQDSQDSATRVVLTWKEQTANPSPPPAIAPTARDLVSTDVDLEAATGRRRVGVTTELALQADAQRVSDSLLARLQTPGWRISGLTIDLSYETIDSKMLTMVMQILDANTRLGLPILLVNLPAWSPTGEGVTQALFLEGGRFVNTDGYWRLELLVSSANAQGKSLLRWVDMPAGVPWDSMGAIEWDDLTGVGI